MAGISWILTSALFVVIHIMTPPQHWGEVTQALIYHQVRKLLLRLDGSRRHVRNWRPQLLLLMSLSDSGGGGDDGGAEVLAETLNHVKKSGLLLLAHVVPVLGRDTDVRRLGEVGVGGHTPMGGGRASLGGSLSKRSPAAAVAAAAAPGAWTSAARSVQSRTRDLLDMIDYNGWKAFPAVAMGASLLSGVQTLVSGGAGLGSLAPNTVCVGLLNVGGGGGAGRSDWLGGEEEYLTALQTCLFFGKSLLVARGFGGASLLDDRGGGSSGGGSAEAGGVTGASETRQVDVWVFPVDGSGGPSAGGGSRRHRHRNLGSSDEEEDEAAGDGDEDRMGRWPSDSTLSLSLQLAYLYVEARRRQAYANGSGLVWRLRLLSYVEATEDAAASEEWLAETLAAARIPSLYSSLRVAVVQQLSLPLYQQLERAHASPGPAAHRPGTQERSPPRRPGRSVLRVLEPLELCQVQNAVVHASTEFGSALLLLPLPVLPMPAASDGGHVGGGAGGGGARAWISTVSELGSGLPASLLVHNPTTAVISTRVG